MTVLLSNSLSALADDVRRAKNACEQSEHDAIEAAINAGGMLCEAKDRCKHGQWLPFLNRAGLSERKAQRWMQLHRGDLKSDTVSLLGGITPALAFLSARDRAMQYFDMAEKAAVHFETTGEGREALLPPIELAMAYIENMVTMFPAEALSTIEHEGAAQ